jgi:polyhydroxybutyrate depolymerase
VSKPLPEQQSPNPASDDGQFHLDPSKGKIESIVHHFNNHEYQAGVSELKALEDSDNHGLGALWRRHLSVINGDVNLKALGISDADQLLGVSKNGNLMTTSSDDSRIQYRQPSDLSVKISARMNPYYLQQIQETKTYEERLAKANDMLAHPLPKGESAQQVESIIRDFNNGNVKDGIATLRTLQAQDSIQEPEMWLRHIAAVNCNVDLRKLGIDNASQILSVDDNGRLVTASSDLSKSQTRSVDDVTKIEKEALLAPSPNITNAGDETFVSFTGDSELYERAKRVQTLMSEAEAARQPLAPGDHRLSITSDGEQRELDVHVPPNYDPTKPTRAFYVLHNALFGGDEAAYGEMENETHLNEKADKENFIVVYAMAETHENPDNQLAGIGFQYHSWNSQGAGMNVTYGNYDDVNYIKAGTRLLDAKLNISDRYLLGLSEGGEFAPHVAGRMPGYWSGIGVWHPTSEGHEAEPVGDPLAYVQITGDKDQVLVRSGGTTSLFMFGDLFGKLYPRLATSEPTEAFDRMAQAQGCTGTPEITRTPTGITTEFTAAQCATRRPVVDIDRFADEHAVDSDTPNGLINWELGRRDGSWDSVQYLVDFLSQYHRHPA